MNQRAQPRLCIVLPSLEMGGTERQVITLIKGMQRSAAPIEIKLLTMVDGGALKAELELAQAAYRSLHLSSTRLGPRALFRMHAALRQARPDVIYSLLNPANFATAIVRPFLPRRIRLVWGIRGQNHGLDRSRLRRRLTTVLTVLLARLANTVVVNSEAARAFVERSGVGDGKIVVVENGIDTDRFRPDLAKRNQTRAELGLRPDRTVLLALGRLVPEKDHLTLLKAVSRLMLCGLDLTLLVVGDDPLHSREQLVDYAVQTGVSERVLFLPRRDDAEAIINAADLLVLSSTSEGTPNVVLEAMACGTPVVATDVGDVGRIVPPDRLSQAADPAALAAAIARALSTQVPRESLLPVRYRTEVLVGKTLSVLFPNL